MEMMRPELYLPQDRGSLPHLFAVLIFPVAFSLLCPFRFPMKIYPNNIISSTITASQDNLNSGSLDRLPLYQTGSGHGRSLFLALLSASFHLSPEASGETCPGLLHMGFSQNPWTISSTERSPAVQGCPAWATEIIF